MNSTPDYHSVIVGPGSGNVSFIVESMDDVEVTGPICLTDVECSEEPFTELEQINAESVKFYVGNKISVGSNVSTTKNIEKTVCA